jgi:NitT/TauT family transport system substrate-binding protein
VRTLAWILVVAAAAVAAYLAVLRGGEPPRGDAGEQAPDGRTAAPARSSAAAAAKRQKLSVGVLPDGESDLVYLAAARGDFEAEGLDVEIAPFKRGRRGLASLERGEVDVAIAGDIGIATDRLPRGEYRIFATIGHADEHLLVVARKDRGVASAADLKGKRVAIEARMNARYLTHRFLAAHGLADRDVDLVQMKLKKLPGALLRGDVDAIVDPLSDNHPAVRGVTGPEIVSFAEPGSYRLSFEAIAPRAAAEGNATTLRAFVRGLLRALDHVRAHPDQAARTLAEALEVEGDRVREAWRHTTLDVSLESELPGTLDEIERWARAGDHLRGAQQPPFATMIDAGALRAERPAAVTLPAAAP